MIYPTITPNEQYNDLSLHQMSLQAGTVIAHLPGTNTIHVRLPGAGDRVIKRVLIPYGEVFQSEDRILIAKSPAETWWMAVCRLQEPDQYGLYGSAALQENELHAPTDFSVYAIDQFLVGQWNAWTGKDLCYEVQHDASANDASINFFYTYGSYFIHKPAVYGRYYARARAMYYDVATDQAFYGAWTAWANDVTVEMATKSEFDSLHSVVLAHIEDMERTWAGHLIGEI